MINVDSESIPVGFRFHPTDEEIVDYYLKSKILGLDSKVRVIPEVDICKREPWQLPEFFLHQFRSTFPYCSEIQANDHRWYFFSRPELKNPNGNNRVNRSTAAGYWKPTGKDREIKSRDTNTLIGTKKTLVFYTGRVRDSKKTNWVIHEYQLNPDLLYPHKNGFVLCLLKRKKNDNTLGEVESSSLNGSSPNDNFALPRPENNRQWSFSFEPIPRANHLASNAQNLVIEDVWELSPRECFSEFTNLQPQMYPEQGVSDTNSIFCYNDFTNNDNEDMQFQSDVMESSEDEIDIGQFLVNRDEYALEDEFTFAEPRGDRIMAARRSEMPQTHLVRVSSDCSLTQENFMDSESSSETDTEVVLQSRVDPIVETFRLLNQHNRRENAGFLDDDIGQYFVSEDEYTFAESRGHRVMAARRSVMPETHLVRVSSDCTLTKEYVKDNESSCETGTEVVLQSRVDPIVETYRLLNEQYRRENAGFLDDESGGSSPSSVNSIADKPIEINRCQLISPEFPVNNARTSRPLNKLRSHNFVAQGTAPGKLCVQEVLHKEPKQDKVRESNCITVKHAGRPDSVKARATATTTTPTTTTKLPQKENSIVLSNNGLRIGGGDNTKLNLMSREQEESSCSNQKGGSIFVETPPSSSHGSTPPSDNAFNLLQGIILVVLFFVSVVLDMAHRISSVFN